MKEVTFIRRNIEKWKETEKVVERAASLSPDQLADAYTDLTADLAFAQTHFPTSRITIYLNNLASALHNEIYRNKREKWTRIITFWTQEVPRTMHDARRELLTSFLIFVASALIGVLSAANDPDFVRLILGNGYVDMTLDNIANGEPMAVYNGSSEVPMFLGITLNNVMVSFNCFAMGLLTSFGTGYMLLSNGIMVGAFQTFFYQHDLLWESSLAIWLHGTLEIWAIIVAGAAGLALGNGWLFPGTYSRLESFRRGAKRGLKIVIGTVPVFIMAGFIEGFLTRHTELPDVLRLGVIFTSLAFIIFYYINYQIEKNMESQKPKVAMYVKRSFGDKLNASFDFIKENWKILLKFTTYLLLPVSLIQALSLNGLMGGAFAMTAMSKTATVPDTASLLGFMSYYGLYMIVFMIGSILLTSMIYALIRTYNEREERLEGITLGILKPLLFRNIKRLLVMTLFSILVMLFVGLVVGLLAFLSLFTLFLTIPLLIAFVVPLALWAPIYLFEDITVMESFKKTFRLGFATWGGVFLISLIMGFIANVLQGVTMMPWYIATLVKYFFSLSDVGSETTVSAGYSFILYLLGIVQAFGAYLSMIFTFVGMAYQYGHASEVVDSVTVESDIDNFDKL